MFENIAVFAFLQHNSTTNSTCPSTPAKLCIDHENKMCMENPTLFPMCMLALYIGLYCSKRISTLPGKFPSRWFYHITFFLYGIMMTSAGILHCFLGGEREGASLLQLVVAVLDAGLTSCIAVTFLFCGLCDIKFLNPKSIVSHWLLFLSYFIVFLLWVLGLLKQWNWIFYVLYAGVISVCCFIYLLTQLCIKSRRSALPALIVGGLYGGLGLVATAFAANHICTSEGPFWSQYIGPEFIWFLFSDISMAFICIYVMRANQQKSAVINTYYIDSEKYSEKY